MNLQEAKNLAKGGYIHSTTKKNADGTPMRARITSIKTWKTRPNEIEIHYKHGMYDFGTIRQNELDGYSPGYGD
jgi:hypothetical protein